MNRKMATCERSVRVKKKERNNIAPKSGRAGFASGLALLKFYSESDGTTVSPTGRLISKKLFAEGL
jgi:hypothetical protein